MYYNLEQAMKFQPQQHHCVPSGNGASCPCTGVAVRTPVCKDRDKGSRIYRSRASKNRCSTARTATLVLTMLDRWAT